MDFANFVDNAREELILRVYLVLPLADVLLSKRMLSKEAYSTIKAKNTPQDQMRELYLALDSEGLPAKTAFYEALKKENQHLVQELESKCGAAAPTLSTDTLHKSQNPLSDSGDGKGKVDDMKTKLKERWHKTSKKWHQKLNLLLDDPDLQSVGDGRLFLSVKEDYEIGSGADGTLVYLGIKADGTEVAIKRIIKAKNKELKNEMSLLRDIKLEKNNIIKYVDFDEDGYFNYLVLQLCEYNLDEYMEHLRHEKEEVKMETYRKLARDVILGLKVLHEADVLHRDVKPSNVLIDVEGNARLGDFGISRRLSRDASTRCTTRGGTRGWEAAEILDGEKMDKEKCRYKKSSDIQVAGMLMYYILSGGHHPFGREPRVEVNIMDGIYSLEDVLDVEAKDLIEGMIPKDPKQRLTVEEALDHPYFWDDERRDAFLRKVGDEKAVQQFRSAGEKLRTLVDKYTEGRTFSGWKSKVPQELSFDKKLPDDLLGLLRFLRNLLVHKKDLFDENNMFRNLFPDFFISAHKLAKEMAKEDT